MGDRDDGGYWAMKRLSRRRLLRGAAVGVVGFGLAGCTATTETPTVAPAATAAATAAPTRAAGAAPQPTAPAAKRGGTIKAMANAFERNLEPHAAGGLGTTGGYGPYICYSQLLTYKWGSDIKPSSYIPLGDLAEFWTQPDELTYIFKIRPNVKFHNIAPVNGRPLVADDIVYSYSRIRDQKTYAANLAGIVRMEAPDKTTFKITLEKPNADILNNLALNTLVIVAKERVEMAGASMEEPPLIGSGPFLFESINFQERFVARRNPDYYIAGQPYIDGFEGFRTPEPSTMVNALRAGSINVIPGNLTVQLAEDLKKAIPTVNIIYIPGDRNPLEIVLNSTLDTFKDIRVRQAISKAIDRKAIVDACYGGRAQITAGLSLPDPSYALPDADITRLLGKDVEGAKKLLKDAGRETGLSFEITAPNFGSGILITMAEVIQANLKDIGIATTIKTVDTTTWLAATQSLNFQAITGTYAGAAPNAWLTSRFATGGSQNWVKYSDPEMDKLIEQQATQARDADARKKILQDIQRKIIDAAVYIPCVTGQPPVAALAEVKDFFPPITVNGHSLVWNTVWIDK
jgi:peptide/nickel transport system substrate-binding protein